jgi:hypothetical protein
VALNDWAVKVSQVQVVSSDKSTERRQPVHIQKDILLSNFLADGLKSTDSPALR